MQPLFLGGHPAIDFLNTSLQPAGEQIETIGDGRAYLDWFVAAGLITDAEAARSARRVGARTLDQAASDARRFREWARAWLTRWQAAPQADYTAELTALNKLLAQQARYLEVVSSKDGLMKIERSPMDSAAGLLGLIGAQVAALVTEEEPVLVKRCAGPTCTLWFLDRSKAHRRVFCSPTACGNRAKVAAFRERQKQ